MAPVTITVDDALTAWNEGRVETRGYADVSAYICDIIRQDMQANGFALAAPEHDRPS